MDFKNVIRPSYGVLVAAGIAAGVSSVTAAGSNTIKEHENNKQVETCLKDMNMIPRTSEVAQVDLSHRRIIVEDANGKRRGIHVGGTLRGTMSKKAIKALACVL
jgi:hypothetical protein